MIEKRYLTYLEWRYSILDLENGKFIESRVIWFGKSVNL